jgi:exonuclease III
MNLSKLIISTVMKVNKNKVYKKYYLKMSTWNIRGFNKEKANDMRFKQILDNSDIIILCETHCSEGQTPNIEGFIARSLSRAHSPANNRTFGGITILYRQEIRGGLTFLEHNTEDYFWFILNKNFFNFDNDIYVCAAYIPPESSVYYKNKNEDSLNRIETDIARYSRNGYIMITGDFNARTANHADSVELDNDMDIHDDHYTYDRPLVTRNSQDVKRCKRGEKLLEICVASRIRILNGRTAGDSLGRYTCNNHMGSSVVDYTIVSEELLRMVPNFTVNNIMNDITDHCCLSWDLKCNYFEPVQNGGQGRNRKFPDRFVWDKMAIMKFQHMLSDNQIQGMLNNFSTRTFCHNREDITQAESIVSDILLLAANKSLTVKKNRPKRKGCNTNKKWFDANLSSAKRLILNKAKLFQNNPFSVNLRLDYFNCLRKYKKLCKMKKKQYNMNIICQLDELRDKNPNAYWKLLTHLKQETNEHNEPSSKIDLSTWETHFKTLNADDTNSINRAKSEAELAMLEHTKEFSESDFKFTETEVRAAIKTLKNGKSMGTDKILNEMLKYSQHVLVTPLVKLFNLIYVSGKYPAKWSKGYIVPIFKTDNYLDPNNYRGITINSSLGKLFNTVVNIRLKNHLKKNNVIIKEQIGFEEGCRTSDHVFVLKTLIDKYTKKGKSLYCAFVDFRKAFDSVIPSLLLHKLQKSGVKGYLYYIIKDMYINVQTKLCVKVDNYLTEEFTSYKGVRQGDPLSPNLFNLYVNDIVEYFDDNCQPVSLLDEKLNCLLYADDLVLLSETQSGLQNCINRLHNYCQDWEMTINAKKTKLMTFNRAQGTANPTILFGDTQLETVDSYKYLGIYFSASGNFNSAIEDLKNRSMKAYFKAIKCFSEGVPSVHTGLHIFDHTIKPVLMYGSEIWGEFDTRRTTRSWDEQLYDWCHKIKMEKTHLTFCRYILGVNRFTAIDAIYGELGRYPMLIEIFCNMFKYWHRLKSLENSPRNRLLIESLNIRETHMNGMLCNKWLHTLLYVLKQCKLDDMWNNGNVSITQFINKLKDSLRQTFCTQWLSRMNSDGKRKDGQRNKLRTYCKFKMELVREKYLSITAPKVRRSVTKLRVSAHSLEIEQARHVPRGKRLPPEKRICKLCTQNMTEDELHFLLNCPQYSADRKILIDQVAHRYNSFLSLSQDIQFTWLMSSADDWVIKLVSSYIHKQLRCRTDALKAIPR